MNYWKECIECAFDEAGIIATAEQVEHVADSVKCSHENYGMAFYSPPAGEHLRSEISALKRELTRERNKIDCPTCDGNGSIHTPGPYHSSVSSCWKCNGTGRVDP